MREKSTLEKMILDIERKEKRKVEKQLKIKRCKEYGHMWERSFDGGTYVCQCGAWK